MCELAKAPITGYYHYPSTLTDVIYSVSHWFSFYCIWQMFLLNRMFAFGIIFRRRCRPWKFKPMKNNHVFKTKFGDTKIFHFTVWQNQQQTKDIKNLVLGAHSHQVTPMLNMIKYELLILGIPTILNGYILSSQMVKWNSTKCLYSKASDIWRNIVWPCQHQFPYIKFGLDGIKITPAC